MDWSRAKTVLIVSFLLLNIVLGIQLYASRLDLLNTETSSGPTKEETLRLLADKSIQLQAEVPESVPRLREIAVHFDDTISMDMQRVLMSPFEFNPQMSRTAMRELIAGAGIQRVSSYRYDPVVSSSGTHVFHQVYDGLPIFEVRLELYAHSGLITTYRQRYVDVELDASLAAQPIISPYVALRNLVDYYLPEGAVITGVQIGYHGQEYNSETMYMLPYWRVTLAGGEKFFVHAFNGAVE